MITAQEIIVGHSGYPTPKIEANAHAMRQLGLGYANLGATADDPRPALRLRRGPRLRRRLTRRHDRPGLRQSANIAARVGPFAAYELNREPMLRVIAKHRDAAYRHRPLRLVDDDRPGRTPPRAAWDEALALGEQHGYRNAQATVLAPTGTIAFMMDCDTTGVEPDIALIKYKKLVGGGMLRIVNQTVPRALARLGYDDGDRSRRSSPTSTPRARSRARPACRTSTCRSSTAPSAPRRACARSARWATSR